MADHPGESDSQYSTSHVIGAYFKRLLMKIMHIQKVAGIGGSERHLLKLLPGLIERDIKIRMCVLSADKAEEFTTAMREDGVDVVTIPAGPHANPIMVARLIREINEFAPDLIHTHLIHADLYGQFAAWIRGRPGVSSVHGPKSFYRSQPIRSLAKWGGHTARRTIAISEHVAVFLKNLSLVPPSRLRVIPYGIDVDEWSVDSGQRSKTRSEMGFMSEDVVIGAFSRLVSGKGHETLIQAFSDAAHGVPRLHLLISGEGPLRGSLEELASSLRIGNVRFTGFIKDVPRVMGACDVVAFPTLPELGEGFGLAALEAMAIGLPVVGSTVGSLPEVISDQETGLLTRPGDVVELANALLRIGEDQSLRRRLGQAGRERARTMFSFERMASSTVALYEEVTNEQD